MTRWTPTGKVMTNLILEVFRVNGDLISDGDRVAGEFGQSSARWQVLGAIGDGAKTVPQIGREMGLSRQAVQRTVDVLADEGVVAFVDNPAHRRSKLVEMTARGRRIYESISEEQVKWVNSLAKEVGVRVEDIRRAVMVLERVRIALEGNGRGPERN
jgi:DNA-binding MarR family transcriptional regulator